MAFPRLSEAILLLTSGHPSQGGGLAQTAGGLCWGIGAALLEEGLQPFRCASWALTHPQAICRVRPRHCVECLTSEAELPPHIHGEEAMAEEREEKQWQPASRHSSVLPFSVTLVVA